MSISIFALQFPGFFQTTCPTCESVRMEGNSLLIAVNDAGQIDGLLMEDEAECCGEKIYGPLVFKDYEAGADFIKNKIKTVDDIPTRLELGEELDQVLEAMNINHAQLQSMIEKVKKDADEELARLRLN